MIEVDISNNQICADKLITWLNKYEWSNMNGYFVMNEITYSAILKNDKCCGDRIFQFPILKGKFVAFCNALPFGQIEFATTSNK